MRIDITHIHSTTSSPLIDFTTVYGTGHAVWASSVPKLHETYDVEFEIPETLVWEETITFAEEASMHISYEADMLHLTGLLEQIDEYGIGALRIGNSLLLIECEALSSYPVHSRYVRISIKQAYLHNTGI